MSRLATIPGPASLDQLRAWLKVGFIHAHPREAARGVWRWSQFGAETVYLDSDPTALLGDVREDGPEAAWVSADAGVYGYRYRDGGGAVVLWDDNQFRTVRALYGDLRDQHQPRGRLYSWILRRMTGREQ
jgi:hypothetical protein